MELPQLQALVDDETGLVDSGSGFGAGSPWIRYIESGRPVATVELRFAVRFNR